MTDYLQGTTLYVRPSTLPQWQDCARRSFARMAQDVMYGGAYAHLLRLGNYELRETGNSIGAAIGTGVHAAAHYTLKTKMDSGDLGNSGEADDRALEAVRKQVREGGVIYDQTSPNLNVAQAAVIRMTRSYRSHVAPSLNPILVETRLDAKHGDMVISGQLDNLCIQKGDSSGTVNELHDVKTGTLRRSNMSQYGTYSLIYRAHGFEIDTMIEDFVPRVGKTKPQPLPERFVMPHVTAEHDALDALDSLRASIDQYQARLDSGGRPPSGAFTANPQSILCSDKYCPAFGTSFCRSHKGALSGE